MDSIGGLSGGVPAPAQQGEVGAPDDQAGQLIAKKLGSIEDVWTEIFNRNGMAHYGITNQPYQPPRLVLFDGAVASACGNASSATGPFYCPADSQVYIDLAFFNELSQRFGAPGDFAQAYVIAHEVGHHLQNMIGLAEKVQRARRQMSEAEHNRVMVMMELQADCFAGVWGHYADTWKKQLSPGDLEEALNAANAIGDDRLQKQAKGYVVPDSFTHGTSEQRMRWFKTGFDTGDPKACDTFNARSL
jgi:predicted metalloprotease